MPDIVKTWPGFMTHHDTRQIFSSAFGRFYFSLGRGCPQRGRIARLFFTHHSRLMGHFHVDQIVQNVGQLPKLRRLDGEESQWQIKPDAWVAICPPPFCWLKEKLYYQGFRGWRYFDLAAYRDSLDAKVRI